MDKRNVFFGEKGLTSTSANHIANMAKEFIQVKSAMVEHLRFVNRNLLPDRWLINKRGN